MKHIPGGEKFINNPHESCLRRAPWNENSYEIMKKKENSSNKRTREEEEYLKHSIADRVMKEEKTASNHGGREETLAMII